METSLLVFMTLGIGGLPLIVGYFILMPHLVIPLLVKCAIIFSPFKKKWIQLNSKMWCSYLERGSIELCTDSILFLHGASGSAVDFMKYGSHFDKSKHLVFLNLLNHSDTASFTRDVEMEDMLDYIDEFIEKSGLIHYRFHLVGFSLGGCISVNFAVKHPHRISSLILINPAGMHDHSELADLISSANGKVVLKSNDDLNKLMDLMSSGTLPHMPNLLLTLLRHHKNYTAEREGYVIRGIMKGLVEVSTLQDLAAVKTMYLQGEIDKVTPKAGLDYFLDHTPHAEYHLIDGGSHLMTYTHIEKICTLINDWLKKC